MFLLSLPAAAAGAWTAAHGLANSLGSDAAATGAAPAKPRTLRKAVGLGMVDEDDTVFVKFTLRLES